MAIKLKVLAVAITLLFAFPQRVLADYREVLVHFNKDNAELLVFEELKFIGEFSTAERALVVFDNLINCSAYIPEGTQLKSVKLEGEYLYIDVSADILDYGGNFYEKHLKAQIVHTGLSLPGIKYVTLLAEGSLAILPEGTVVDRVDEWEELMD